MKAVKNDLITVFFETFKPQNASFSGAQNLGLFNVTYDITRFNMNTIQIDSEKSVIKFQQTKPNIITEFVDLQMDLYFNFSIKAQPEFYLDEGQGRISFWFNKTSVGLGMFNNQGVFQFNVEDVSAVYWGSNSYFHGTGDLSFALNQAALLLNGFMEQNINQFVKLSVAN